MILIAFGTRPEYIKVKSLIENMPNVKTFFTGQHIDLLKGIKVDYTVEKLKVSSDNRLNSVIQSSLQFEIPEGTSYVVVQGDTTSALAIALSAFNSGIPVVHLEAGLRTHNKFDPYPEEMNRQLISRIASIHFCPTVLNKKNLLKESVSGDIFVVGNTGLDNIDKEGCFYGNKVLITMHRRDNHPTMDRWFIELSKVAKMYQELDFILPIHPNPNVQKHKHLLEGINVVEPMSHQELLNILRKCRFLITDSGGIQEEASFLNKRVVVCRQSTERPEVLEHHGILCSKPELLIDTVNKVNNDYYINKPCPFGDGTAYVRIVNIFSKNFETNGNVEQ